MTNAIRTAAALALGGLMLAGCAQDRYDRGYGRDDGFSLGGGGGVVEGATRPTRENPGGDVYVTDDGEVYECNQGLVFDC
ncbi:MAG: hypothetical protein ACFBWO_07910 [Paracoccaceae bacterium]